MVAVKIILIIFLVIFLISIFLIVIACAGIAGRCSKAEREWYDSIANEDSASQNQMTNNAEDFQEV